MALKDWIQKTENKEDPPAIMANLAIIPDRKPENSHNSHNSHRESPKMKHSNQTIEKGIVPFDYQIELAIDELNRKGISIMDYPLATRRRALLLERELTKAKNRGEWVSFKNLLKQWQNCFN